MGGGCREGHRLREGLTTTRSIDADGLAAPPCTFPLHAKDRGGGLCSDARPVVVRAGGFRGGWTAAPYGVTPTRAQFRLLMRAVWWLLLATPSTIDLALAGLWPDVFLGSA